jgi:D-3-phosphoglycerate dehydrogenase
MKKTLMESTVKIKVVRSGTWTDPIFDQQVAQLPNVDLNVFPVTGADEAAWAMLEQAHVYHLMVAKDEFPSHWHVSAELLQRCPALLCVSASGAGYDTIDVDACTEAGVAVLNQAGGNANSVAEMTLGLILAVSRRIGEQNSRMRRDTGYSREDVMGNEISGKVLGLIGIGHIGSRVAEIATAFGMTVLATDPGLSRDEISKRGAQPVELDELLARSDFVSLHCPRNKITANMMDAEAFAKMKPRAAFISTARGGIHDEAALFDALKSGHLSGAGLDVWSVEPPPLNHPLLSLDNVVATFHTAGVSHEARYNIAYIAALQIGQVLEGTYPPRLVNPEVWPQFASRFEATFGTAVKASLKQ